jgi:lipid II:glycine glycyltransferase (peptidoglycan interpeptide bridge formation enzyme)
MTFEVLPDPDRVEWDAFVATSATGHFMQSRSWGDFQRLSGWQTHYLLWRDKSVVRAVALLLSRKLPLHAGRVFYAPRGPVLDFADTATAAFVETDLKKFLAEQKAIFLRTDPYIDSADTLPGRLLLPGSVPVTRDWSYWNAPKLVLWLKLAGEEEEIFKRMTATCRNEVRRGYRSGVEFTNSTTDGLEDFFRLMTVTGQHKGIAVHDLDYYRRLFAQVNTSAEVRLFLGRFESNVITAGVSLRYGKKAWLLYAASSPDSYKLRANRTLQWEMIKWAHAAGCERYDFRGTATNDPPSPEDPGYGVYEFKKSFGPEYVRLAGYYDLVQRPVLYRMFRYAEEKLLPTAYRVRTWLGERGKR